MADAELKVKGLDELKMSFDQLVAKYPDKAGDLLKKDALALRRNITLKNSQRRRASIKSRLESCHLLECHRFKGL